MADVNIQVQAEVNQAVASLGKVNTALGKTGTAAEKSGGGFKSMVGKLNGAVTATTGFNLSQLGTVAVLAKGIQVLKQSVTQWVSYSNAMTDGARLTGIQVDEYSKLVQVADDVRLSQEQLKTAFQIASRQGIDVSIDGIKKLSDQYNSLTDPVEKAQLLLKTFGRSGADMGRLMEIGGAGIDAATAAVAKNLIVTKDSAAQAEAARLAFDNLEDTWQGMKNTLAQAVIPSLTKLLDLFNEGITVSQKLKNWNGSLADVWEDHRQKLEKLSGSWEEYAFEMIRSGIDAKKFNGVAATQAQLLVDGQLSVEGYSLNLKELAKYLKLSDEATFYANKEMVEFNGTMYDTPAALAKAKDEFARLHPELVQNAEDTDTATAAVDEFKDQIGLLNSAISGQVGKELDSYSEKMNKIETETSETILKIEELEAIKNPTKDQQDDLDAARQSLIDLGDAAKQAAKDHHEAMAKIIYDMAQVRAEADGVITKAEYDSLSEYARRMGLLDQSTLDAQYAMQLMGDELELHPEYYNRSAMAMEALTRALDDGYVSADELENIMRTLAGGTWDINANVNVDDSELDDVLQRIIRGATLNVNIGGAGTGNPIPMAEGGSGIVNKPTLFLAGEAGPERYNFQPINQHTTTTQTYNLTMNTQNANAESVILGFRAMQLMEQ